MLKAETKADIKDMATKTDIAEVKTDIAESKTEVKTDIVELKAEMYRLNNRTIMWMVGTAIAIVSIIKLL